MVDLGKRLIWTCALLGSMGATASSEAPNAPCLAVVDSSHTVLGALMETVSAGGEATSDGSRVAIDVRGRIFTVLVNATGVIGGDEGRNFVLFETADCSGSPFISSWSLDSDLVVWRPCDPMLIGAVWKGCVDVRGRTGITGIGNV